MMKHYEVYVGRCEEKKVHLIDNFTIHTGEAGDLALLNKCVEKFCRRSGYQYMSGSFKLGVGFVQKVGKEAGGLQESFPCLSSGVENVESNWRT